MTYQDIINPADLVPMDIFTGDLPITIDLAYAGSKSFCGVIYRAEARLWLYRDLAAMIVRAARHCYDRHGYQMVLYDGLRTVEAQQAMLESDIVKAHPHWLEEESRVLSPPGTGGHPRAMAVDVSLMDRDGRLLDMGTKFDELPEQGSGPDVNRAHRDYKGLPDSILENRCILTESMMSAADQLGLELLPLPVEWWDFRFPKEISDRYAPLSDRDVPPQMRMTSRYSEHKEPEDFSEDHFEQIKKEILQLL